MPTTIEKFVFEIPQYSPPTGPFDDETTTAPPASFNEVEFQMNATSKIVLVKINRQGAPALYALVDSDQEIVSRRFAYFKTGESLPSNWIHVGSYCNGNATVHIGEVIVTN